LKTSEKQISRLISILADLRGPNGCPWDKEQTYKDINPYMLEEVHEVMEAIDNNDFEELKKELGDLLMHIVFHCQLASEEGRFTLADVAEAVCEKLIRRHPHVFGETKVKDSEEVLRNWEKIKAEERKEQNHGDRSLLEGLPKALPSLLRALRIGEKAHRVGFDWSDSDGVFRKVEEELSELRDVIASPDGAQDGTKQSRMEEELGDLLFTLVSVGRFLKIDSDSALRKSTNKFVRRFQQMEKEIRLQNRSMHDLSPAEWDVLWSRAKSAV